MEAGWIAEIKKMIFFKPHVNVPETQMILYLLSTFVFILFFVTAKPAEQKKRNVFTFEVCGVDKLGATK